MIRDPHLHPRRLDRFEGIGGPLWALGMIFVAILFLITLEIACS